MLTPYAALVTVDVAAIVTVVAVVNSAEYYVNVPYYEFI